MSTGRRSSPVRRARWTAVLLAAVAWPLAAPAGEESCEDCHPDLRESLEGEHNHAPFAKGDCYECHEPHGFDNQVKLKGTVADLCTTCHVEIFDLPNDLIHYPVLEERACLHCHVPHGADNPDLLAAPPVRLCGECHDGPSEDGEGLHPPFASGECVECHAPHGSLFPSFLKLPTGYVCMGCHVEILDGEPLEEFHTVSGDKSCDNCHNGHEGKGGALLRTTPPDLCLGCHREIRARLELEFAHDAAEDCTSCHAPHHPLGPGVRGEVCADCHDTEEEAFLRPHLGVSPGTCTGCHDPHGSSRPALAREFEHVPFEERECDTCHADGRIDLGALRDRALCLDCHDEPAPVGGHDPERTESRTCVDCHSPHGSGREALLR